MKNENTIESDPAINAYVQCIVRPITVQAAPYVKVGKWEVVVFRSNQVNAFALPGGKIGVYTGILRVANKADQLAAVLGHEVGHVLAEHGNERVSQSLVAQGGLSLVSSLFSNSATHNMLMGLLSAGTQLGILLPFSRKHETEADLIGLKLMAPVGFDPRGAVELWQNMAKASGGRKTPEIFSTHPSDDTRIRDLQEAIPSVMDTYEQALASGKRPNCVAPKITQENLPEPPPAKNAPSAGSDSEEDDS